ncbi:hypothetical protein RhiirA5_449898 [Rhizophagus irregularis]|uniref:Uncharacterized protein n=1 Tax=Rhizophagus irregularis TaxID=588596 RepID=A0A2N0PAX3_9GLOM|nr:hypothetical protein RhiirA5_449898 [Rhizophagus irregularis]
MVTGRQFIFDGTHGFRISDLTVGRVTFDTGFLQATCSSDLFDPFFVRVVGFSVFLDADLGRAKDTSSTTVAGYVLAMGMVLNSVDEHMILNGVVAFSSGGVFTAQCLHFSSVLGPRASVVFNHHLRLFLRFLQLQVASNILKLGNNHLMKSAVISQELQLGILSNRVKTISKKEEESELEEVNENEESLTKVQLFISKMENVNCKYHIINLFEKNLVKKILGGNETICQRKTEYGMLIKMGRKH